VSHPQVIAQLDMEHADLAARLDGFARRLFEPASREEIAECLRGMIIDIGMHFGFEESLMEEGGCADFEHHRRQHLGIMTELGLLLDRVESDGDAVIVARSADWLAHWYGEHVAQSDRALLDWLASS
jgi:hemerythrin-like metal-binding protein